MQREFLLGASKGVRQSLEQRQPLDEVVDRLLVGTAPQGILRRLPQILHRSTVVPPLLKVYCQFCRYPSGALLISCLLPLSDPSMQLEASSHRHPIVQHILIQGVYETVAPRHRPVWPVALPTRLEELSSPC